jgi:DNA-binding winged helix-turn-helix (wHTH) protein
MTNSLSHNLDRADRAPVEGSLEFGRFRVLLRQRLLLADGVPIELGTRAFELLLALLEANGSLVSKEQLLARVWPHITVAQDAVKVHVSALRKALGENRDFIRTEVGRGYRFIAAVRSTVRRSLSQPQCDGGAVLKRCCFLDGSLGDLCTVGRPKPGSTAGLFPLAPRVPHPAKNSLSQCRGTGELIGHMLFSNDPTDRTRNSMRAIRTVGREQRDCAFTPKRREAEVSDEPAHD